MNWPKRVFYYLIGLSLGGVVVYFIWSGKKVSFDYGMDARTLKQIRIREKVYTPEAHNVLTNNNLDSVTVNTILKNGDVSFGESKPRLKPCPEYLISGKGDLKNIQLYVKRCDSIATIEKVIIK
ncbi:DUF4258 domain-containing protein [Polaribacter uvawellassae]|uniref:DUF4258 domain-containing protein n=1 Tax=Polaribacter uvawellassae TaxID=3133495 RepID=UPI00321B8EBE